MSVMAACSAAAAWRERAEAGDTGEQGERGGRALPRGVLDQALADQLLDAGPADGVMPLRPPGAEQVADEQLRIQRAAHREQLTGRVQELSEQRVGGRATTCLATYVGSAGSP